MKAGLEDDDGIYTYQIWLMMLSDYMDLIIIAQVGRSSWKERRGFQRSAHPLTTDVAAMTVVVGGLMSLQVMTLRL